MPKTLTEWQTFFRTAPDTTVLRSDKTGMVTTLGAVLQPYNLGYNANDVATACDKLAAAAFLREITVG